MTLSTNIEKPTAPGRVWMAWLGALLLFCGGLVVQPGIGVGFDEHVHATYGEMVLEFFQSGGADRRHETYKNLMIYGPWVDTLAAVLYGGEGQRSYLIRHVVALAFTALTLPAAFFLGRAAGGSWQAGLVAMVAMALMPRYLGHGMFNTKDVPFACIFAWSFAWVWAIRGQSWRLGWREALGLGVLAGLGMGIRVGGLLIFITLGATAAVAWTREVLQAGKLDLSRVRATAMALLWWAVAFAIAYAIMVAVWPWSWSAPFARPMEALELFSAFHHQAWLAYEGKVVSSRLLPLSYLPAHLLLGTPLPWLALGALGLGAALAGLWKPSRLGGTTPDSARESTALGMLMWLVIPLLYVFLSRPTLYGAGRQFFFMAPAIAVAAAMGFSLLWRRFPKHQPRLLAWFGLGAVWTAWGIFTLHPYEHTYYNEFAGSRATLPERFEMDDWALSYREAAEWLNEQQRRYPDRPLRVLVAANDFSMPCLMTFMNPLTNVAPYFYSTFDRYDSSTQMPRLPETVDYYVTLNDPHGARMFSATPIIHEVRSNGAVLCIIRANTPRPRP